MGSLHSAPWELEHSQGRKVGGKTQQGRCRPDYRDHQHHQQLRPLGLCLGSDFFSLKEFIKRWWPRWLLQNMPLISLLIYQRRKKWFTKANVSQTGKRIRFHCLSKIVQLNDRATSLRVWIPCYSSIWKKAVENYLRAVNKGTKIAFLVREILISHSLLT